MSFCPEEFSDYIISSSSHCPEEFPDYNFIIKALAVYAA